MSDSQIQFDSHVAEANSAAVSNSAALQNALPGMHPADLRRLLANISKHLGNVDRRDIKHPEYLAGTPQNVPQKAVELCIGVKPSFDAGVDNFVQNHLPALVEVDRKLVSAVGVGSYKIREIKQSQVRALDQIIDRSDQKYNRLNTLITDLNNQKKSIDEILTDISEKRNSAVEDQKKIVAIHKTAEQLARGNAAQNPLEKLVRAARDRSVEIEEVLAKAKVGRDDAVASAKVALENRDNSISALTLLGSGPIK